MSQKSFMLPRGRPDVQEYVPADRLTQEKIDRAIREAALAEREAILNTLRLLRDEHCTGHAEASGVQGAIDCIRVRE